MKVLGQGKLKNNIPGRNLSDLCDFNDDFVYIDVFRRTENYSTSFITDMRCVVRVRAQGFLILPCLLSRARFNVVCPLNKFKVRSDVLSLNF